MSIENFVAAGKDINHPLRSAYIEYVLECRADGASPVTFLQWSRENAEPMDAPDYATERDIDRAESEDITYREFGGLS